MDRKTIALVQETADRCRRIETRQAKYLNSIGFETGARRPVWSDGFVEVPSPAASLTDILSAIPADWDNDVAIDVVFDGRSLGSVLRPDAAA